MRKHIITILAILLLGVSFSYADEPAGITNSAAPEATPPAPSVVDGDPSSAHAEPSIKGSEDTGPVYKFPAIEPQYGLSIGYSYSGLNGDARASEFEYLHNSIVFTGELRALPFPHRFYLDFDYLNSKDRFVDANYAFKDIVLFRWLFRGLFHNLDNISMYDPDPSTVNTWRPDSAEKYGIGEDLSNWALRLKIPDFPFHIILSGQNTDKEGSRQVRYLGGSGNYNEIVRSSKARDVNWHTTIVNYGFNSHLGPVEVEVLRSERKFESKGDRVLNDWFNASGGNPSGYYDHNLVPSFESSSTSLKLHSSYTGKLVMSGTLIQTEQRNNDSGIKSEYLNGSANAVYMPYTWMTFYVRYRHSDYDVTAPPSIVYSSAAYALAPAVTAANDVVSGVMKVRASKYLTVNAELKSSATQRTNALEAKLPEETVKNSGALSFVSRPCKTVKVEAKYSHLDVSAPAYNTEADSSDKGVLSLSWKMGERVSALASMDYSKDKRDGLLFEDAGVGFRAGNRDSESYRTLGILTFLLGNKATLTTSYSHIESKITQTIVYDDFSTLAAYILDDRAKYLNRADTFSLDLGYKKSRRLFIDASASWRKSKVNFYPSSEYATGISAFSDMQFTEKMLALTGLYDIRGGWNLELSYKSNRFDNLADDQSNPNASDGTTHIVTMKLMKRWQ